MTALLTNTEAAWMPKNLTREERHQRLISNGVPSEGGSLWGHGRMSAAPDYVIDRETGCWEWQKYLNPYRLNYPWTNVGPAARLYYEAAHGGERLPSDVDCHHLCKNKLCVNPDHLETIHGMTHRMAHFLERTGLTPEKVLEIRKLGADPAYSNTRLCEMYGICDKTLWSLLNGKRWAQWSGGGVVRWYTNCQWCDAELTGRWRTQKYCDPKCRGFDQRARKAALREAA